MIRDYFAISYLVGYQSDLKAIADIEGLAYERRSTTDYANLARAFAE